MILVFKKGEKMNIRKFVTKSKMMITSILAIGSLLMIAASPALAKTDSEGPIRISPISPNASTDVLSAKYHHDMSLYRQFKGDMLQAKALTADFTRVINSKDRTQKTTTADYHTYQGDLKRTADISTDLAPLFATHTGFNREGEVTNAAQALRTLNLMDADLSNGLFWTQHAINELELARENRMG
jgi:hypothetical protein